MAAKNKENKFHDNKSSATSSGISIEMRKAKFTEGYLLSPRDLGCIIHESTDEFGFYVFICGVCNDFMVNRNMTDCLFDARADPQE